MKYTENIITRQMTFSKCLGDIFKKADALERLCNVEVDILIFSSAGPPYVFRSSCFQGRVKRFRNPNFRKRRYLSSLKQARILKSQAKLKRLTEELERNKERGKVLDKRLEETLEKYNMKNIKDSKLEESTALKKKLENLRDYRMSKMEASSSLLMQKDGKEEM